MSARSTLRILRKSLLTGAREAQGLVVVIDVLRAFSTADPIYCLQRDLFDFVLVAREEQGLLVARPERC